MAFIGNKFGLVACVVAIVLCSCSNKEQGPDGFSYPVAPPSEVVSFFDTYLPASESSSLSDMIFNFPDLDYQSNECMLVNSRKEFRDLLTVEVPLPDIDFKKYSLIIGKCTLGDPGYVLDEQMVHAESDHMKLQLCYRRLDGVSPSVITDFYFWGLYQKLPDLPLEVDLDIT
jgi:hypothetical protein